MYKKLVGVDVFRGLDLDNIVDKAITEAYEKFGEFPEIDVKFLKNWWVVTCHVYRYESKEKGA
jgi:hypothetical protein